MAMWHCTPVYGSAIVNISTAHESLCCPMLMCTMAQPMYCTCTARVDEIWSGLADLCARAPSKSTPLQSRYTKICVLNAPNIYSNTYCHSHHIGLFIWRYSIKNIYLHILLFFFFVCLFKSDLIYKLEVVVVVVVFYFYFFCYYIILYLTFLSHTNTKALPLPSLRRGQKSLLGNSLQYYNKHEVQEETTKHKIK